MLTTILGPIAILSSWSAIQKREKEYYILLLLLADGHARRLHVARFRAVLRLLGSDAGADVFPDWRVGKRPTALRGDQVLSLHSGRFGGDAAGDSGDLFQRRTRSIFAKYCCIDHRAFLARLQTWLFWGFFFAFAIKVPMFPFHTWLPDAHTEAPTAGSVILAGVLLKMGTYGFLRFSVPMFPDAAMRFRWIHDCCFRSLALSTARSSA